MRYVVLGAGAVGGVIGARLHLAGVPTTLVARGAHLDRVRDQGGMVLDTADGRLLADAPVAGSAAGVAWTDDTVVLLAVKSHQTPAALDDLVAHAPPSTPVVCAQNGVANEAVVLRRMERTYGMCVMLPSTHLEPGAVVQKCHPVPGILDLGRFPTGSDEVAEAVAADLQRAGFESVPRPDIMAWKHRKLLMNVGNGVDAACLPDGDAEKLADLARDEGERVLAAAGIPVVTDAEDRARRGDTLRRRTDRPPAGGSTWQSLTRGLGTVETDYLAGEIVLLGRLHGIPTPVNALVQQVTADLARRRGPARSIPAADLLARL
ncbi:2-dehydropantoate 2-reductase [Nocardioides ginsengisegetis]|uniref:2-dehydropantoate 2-reductase n=1 Tax=Nocardioides ginsengisegetis TaxID=661491 RepID=A0A7W3IX20_9ACTN|nr:ketopantoate reductase family protein [Nocardioides ginsengisegetis]MBA8802089.1 2-dehydropantoate 2-reductase [Nocardioides ginsengisegetis]